MVFAVRCPAPGCRKYMLVEDTDRGRVVACLVCKQPVRVPAAEVVVSDAPAAGLPTAKALPPT